MNLGPIFGPGRAMRSVLEGHRAALFRVAHAWTHDRALADDLAQEALLKAVRCANQLREPERLRSWLFGIMANCWRDHLRARRPTVDIDALDDDCFGGDETPESSCARAQVVARVRAAVARLPNGQRQVLTLVDLEEFSYAEVAEILGIPIGTVMSRLCRGRLALRSLLHEADAARTPALRSVK
jgi:RNA polymerase sigma-70 factor (ECF subfamily)